MGWKRGRMNWKSGSLISCLLRGEGKSRRTGRLVGICLGEGELRLEVAAVVERVGIQDDERDAPLKDVVVDQLGASQPCGRAGCPSETWRRTSMLVHVSLLSALNSFMSMRSADCAMATAVEQVRGRLWARSEQRLCVSALAFAVGYRVRDPGWGGTAVALTLGGVEGERRRQRGRRWF